ncbi:general transcription factor 3C polypeptide 4 [Dunckerocampus dactyliophorus]|uniref:general transcription factor 3C polypeptide 4 n=1 Tax=Dunckerocampus dactyliophorus TaxID=161453 RepID=UPI0024064B24|nr:general transcription factor 3C polypeptide 4 [Dunckerocampus dactyliophorus]
MELESGDDVAVGTDDLPVKRDPVVSLLSPVIGTQPLVWSQDHRLAVCTSTSLAMMELVCDVQSSKQELILHRSSIPVPSDSHELQVGPAQEQAKAIERISSHPDPTLRQAFLLDRVIDPLGLASKGVKNASWSPFGCDSSGRCLLACLTLDNRLTIHHSHKRLTWNLLVDLTKKYGDMLQERGYAKKDDKPPQKNLRDFEELQRRFQMQTPLRMKWSSIYTVKQVQADNMCVDVEMVLLAVLMENGDLVLWKFVLPFENGADVVFYDVIESEVSRPSDLAWWEYENAGRRMSGLIVGSELGTLQIMPVSMVGVKGYFTLRHPVILWKECDQIAVENIMCVSLVHPIQKVSCSLIVASRGCYIYWCLLMISPTGLNVYNSHVVGLHSLPVVSLAVTKRGVVYTCSMDGWIKKLTPKFTEKTLIFNQENMLGPEFLAERRLHAIALSCNGAYIALASTQGLVDMFHPIHRTYQVHFIALKSPETAAGLLLKSCMQNLYKQADLLDLVRWNILKNKSIPEALQQELDQKIQEVDSAYLWRFKLFLFRILYQSLQTPPTDHYWKPSHEASKTLLKEEEDGEEAEDLEKEYSEAGAFNGMKQETPEEKMEQVKACINSVEAHLVRENMKKVLGVVYLNTRITENTCIPTLGMAEHLSKDTSDKDAKVLIGHIKKKMHKQTFSEHCSLCQDVLPFTDHKQAVCENGHMWFRCVLSYQACQALTFRRCLLQDSISGLPAPDDPQWIKKILQAPCLLCDSPMI